MQVICEGTSSSDVPIESGVPPGTVLGPLLFLCHINDLSERVTYQVWLFADDFLLYKPIRSDQDRMELQQDLLAFEQWATKWGMRFNAKMCYIMHISPKSRKMTHMYILCVSDNPYLGLQICILRRNLKFLPKQYKSTAYQFLVRSNLEYGCIMWEPYIQHDINSFERGSRTLGFPHYNKDGFIIDLDTSIR